MATRTIRKKQNTTTEIIINLTPKNYELINLIPNKEINLGIIFNKFIEQNFNEFISVIEHSLDLKDLKEFTKNYNQLSEAIEALISIKEEVVENTIKDNKKEQKSVEFDTKNGFSEDTF